MTVYIPKMDRKSGPQDRGPGNRFPLPNRGFSFWAGTAFYVGFVPDSQRSSTLLLLNVESFCTPDLLFDIDITNNREE